MMDIIGPWWWQSQEGYHSHCSLAQIHRRLSEAEESDVKINDGRDPSYIGILGLVALVAALIFHTVLKRWPIPFTVLALGLGIILGELNFWTGHGLGALSDSINNWQKLHPNTIFVIFLPPLIFESASTIDYHIFYKALNQTLLLAIPGVLINTILICLVAMYIFPFDWDFTTSLTFGAMLSATDPVAIVALLRDLGAPLSLSTIIEGESLLNDGVAFVIFLFMADLMKGNTGNFADFIGDALYASGVGILVGGVLGYIISFVSSGLFDDTLPQLLLTIIGAFGTWFIADGLLEASGVLAVVALGLHYAAFRHGGISVQANQLLENFWGALSFIANAVIFVRSGTLISYSLHHSNLDLTYKDWLYLLVFYVLVNIIRLISVAVLYPFLARTGYGFNVRWAAICSWGGLRGAISLSFGMFLLNEEKIPRFLSAKMMFFVSGIVTLTLLFNAVSAGPLVRYLSLNRQSAAAKTFYYHAVSLISRHIDESITLLQRSSRHKGTDWQRVWEFLPVLSQEMKNTVERQIGHSLPMSTMRQANETIIEVNDAYALVEDQDNEALLRDARIRFLNLVKSSYHRDFQAGAVTSKSFISILIDSASEAQEKANSPLSDWKSLESHGKFPSWYSRIPIHCIRHMLVVHRLSVSYQVASAFIQAHESVKPFFSSVAPNTSLYDTIVKESNEEVQQAHMILKDLEVNFPDITRTIKTRQATEIVLNELNSYAEDLLQHGEIEEKELKSIVQGIHYSRARMWLLRFRVTDPEDRENVFRTSELFIGVSNDLVDELLHQTTEKVFVADEVIQHSRSLQVHGIFVVGHGNVHVSIDGSLNASLFHGDVINSLVAVSEGYPCFQCVAKTDVRVFFIEMEVIHRLLAKKTSPSFIRNIYFRAGVEAALVQRDPAIRALSANPWNTGAIMSKAQVQYPLDNVQVEMGGGIGILFQGRISKVGDKVCLPLHEPVMAFPCDSPLEFQNHAVFLWIPPAVSWMLDTFRTITPDLQRSVHRHFDVGDDGGSEGLKSPRPLDAFPSSSSISSPSFGARRKRSSSSKSMDPVDKEH